MTRVDRIEEGPLFVGRRRTLVHRPVMLTFGFAKSRMVSTKGGAHQQATDNQQDASPQHDSGGATGLGQHRSTRSRQALARRRRCTGRLAA